MVRICLKVCRRGERRWPAQPVGKRESSRVITEVNGEYVQESIFTLEPGEKFGKITFQMMSGPDKGKTWVGIYQLDGEILEWCGSWKGDTDKLPSDFTTKEGDLTFLRVMKLLKR